MGKKRFFKPTDNDLRSDVDKVLDLLDSGKIRVSEKNGLWEANQWLKRQYYYLLKLKIIQYFQVELLI